MKKIKDKVDLAYFLKKCSYDSYAARHYADSIYELALSIDGGRYLNEWIGHCLVMGYYFEKDKVREKIEADKQRIAELEAELAQLKKTKKK